MSESETWLVTAEENGERETFIINVVSLERWFEQQHRNLVVLFAVRLG